MGQLLPAIVTEQVLRFCVDALNVAAKVRCRIA